MTYHKCILFIRHLIWHSWQGAIKCVSTCPQQQQWQHSKQRITSNSNTWKWMLGYSRSLLLRHYTESCTSGHFTMTKVKRAGNLMSWATCQWNLAEADKSCCPVVDLSSSDVHTNQRFGPNKACQLICYPSTVLKTTKWKWAQSVDHLWTTYIILEENNNNT